MMQNCLLRITAEGAAEIIPAAEQVTAETLAALLHTDVTERMRIPVMPEFLSGNDTVLCYLIDARGGDRGLPANFLGTCFYHTGCPVHGDLLIAACSADSSRQEISGFSEADAQRVLDWLREQFSAYLT